MPLNESTGARRSNLTKEQRKEQEAAIYGLQPTPNMELDELTTEDIDRMRAILAQHDRNNKPEQIDLNNPKTPPYRYQKFPHTIYNHAKRINKIVRSEDELQGFLELGWTDAAYPAEAPPEVALDAVSAAEAAQVDQQLAALRASKKK